MSQISSLDEEGEDAGDDADDKYDGDANCDYELIMIINYSNLSSNCQL